MNVVLLNAKDPEDITEEPNKVNNQRNLIIKPLAAELLTPAAKQKLKKAFKSFLKALERAFKTLQNTLSSSRIK